RIDPAQIQYEVDLLCTLLRRHYRGQVLPKSLDARLIQLLRVSARWHDWPLEQIVPSRASFLAFLQERWPIFLQQKLSLPSGGISGATAGYALRYAGPAELPFDHDDVRVYLDTLFTDGVLTRTRTVEPSLVEGTWMAVGVHAS